MTDNYIEISSQDFTEKVLEAQQMVLMNVWAENSGARLNAPDRFRKVPD